MKRILAIACALAVGACAAITEPLGMEDPFAVPQPFAGVGRNDAMLAQAIEVPILVIRSPQGMSDEMAARLRDHVIEAARNRDVPALAEATTPRAWVLSAQTAVVAAAANSGLEQGVVSWRLVDAAGSERGQFAVNFAGTAADLSPGAIQLLAERTARALEAALRRPRTQVAEQQAAPKAAAFVGTIKGAPGDGNEALARALQAVLPIKGVRVEARREKATWSIEGKVKVAHKSPTEDVVSLIWRVLDAKGTEVGTIAQENVVPRGRFKKPWAEVAGFAAEAAAEGIAQLLQQVAQAKGA